jgi:peptidoglycan/LPS O-acetylase OafA/YrhL
MSALPGGHRFRTLDGLRGLAALLVMAHHMRLFFYDHLPEAYLAVDFFFVLSGVVIAQAYQLRLGQGLSAPQFFRLRWARIYPYYGLGLLLGVPAVAVAFSSSGNPSHTSIASLCGSFVFNLWMLPSPFSFALYPFVGTAWTLAYELLVNLFYAVRLRRLQRPVLAAIMALAGLGLACLAFSQGSLGLGFKWGLAHEATGLARVLYSFICGLLIQRMDRSAVPRIKPGLILSALLLLLCMEPSAAMRPVFDLAAVLLVLPLLVLLGAVSEPGGAREAGLYAFFGGVSYGVYAVHYPVVWLVGSLASAYAGGVGPVLGLLTMAAVVGVVAWLDRAYDAPLRRRLLSSGRP